MQLTTLIFDTPVLAEALGKISLEALNTRPAFFV